MTPDDMAALSPAATALRNITDEQRASIRRELNGEADRDLLRRGSIRDVIRALRTDPVKSLEYQQALSDVSRAISKLEGVGEQGL
jgi:hypothetical protein